MLVSPALHGVFHRAGNRKQQRVGRGRQAGHGGEEMVPAGQVRLLVGDQRRPATAVQAIEQVTRDHDATGPAGQRVSLDERAGHDNEAVVGFEPGGTPV